MDNKGFVNTFLSSLTEKMAANQKYKNSMILSDKQRYYCEMYMQERQCKGDYGWFTNFECEANGKKYLMSQKGKYTFLSFREVK
jgi:hypothetical protein